MRIVANAPELMKLCDDLESRLKQAEEDGDKLFEAVLAQLTAA